MRRLIAVEDFPDPGVPMTAMKKLVFGRGLGMHASMQPSHTMRGNRIDT